jgi:hypothetical protein
MFERLGGAEIRAVAARWFEDPNPISGEEYRRRCLPYYNPIKGDPDVFARTIFREDVGIHFWGDEIRRFDLLPEVARIRRPTLVLSGELDRSSPSGIKRSSRPTRRTDLRIPPRRSMNRVLERVTYLWTALHPSTRSLYGLAVGWRAMCPPPR